MKIGKEKIILMAMAVILIAAAVFFAGCLGGHDCCGDDDISHGGNVSNNVTNNDGNNISNNVSGNNLCNNCDEIRVYLNMLGSGNGVPRPQERLVLMDCCNRFRAYLAHNVRHAGTFEISGTSILFTYNDTTRTGTLVGDTFTIPPAWDDGHGHGNIFALTNGTVFNDGNFVVVLRDDGTYLARLRGTNAARLPANVINEGTFVRTGDTITFSGGLTGVGRIEGNILVLPPGWAASDGTSHGLRFVQAGTTA